MEAIILSGMPAVGKTTVAKIIAEKLGLRVIGGGDALKEIAAAHGLDPQGEDWWDTRAGIKFLEVREDSPAIDREVDKRLIRLAEEGNVVITSYTLPWLSKRGVKIWLAGNFEKRARRMTGRNGIILKESKKILRIRDRENYNIYKKMYNLDFGYDMKPFDLIVVTDKISARRVASRIINFLDKRRSRIAD